MRADVVIAYSGFVEFVLQATVYICRIRLYSYTDALDRNPWTPDSCG